MDDKKIYFIMHKYGKLTSCNADKPSKADIMFVEELKISINIENGKQKTLI